MAPANKFYHGIDCRKPVLFVGMKKINMSFEQLAITKHLLKWTLLVLPISFFAGSVVALFLWLLDKATLLRWQYNWLLWLLPLAGILIYFLYKKLGKNSDAGMPQPSADDELLLRAARQLRPPSVCKGGWEACFCRSALEQ